jgi:hypothetical protein
MGPGASTTSTTHPTIRFNDLRDRKSSKKLYLLLPHPPLHRIRRRRSKRVNLPGFSRSWTPCKERGPNGLLEHCACRMLTISVRVLCARQRGSRVGPRQRPRYFQMLWTTSLKSLSSSVTESRKVLKNRGSCWTRSRYTLSIIDEFDKRLTRNCRAITSCYFIPARTMR